MNHRISYGPNLVLIFFAMTTLPVLGADFDVILRGGTVYDGSGQPPVVANVGMRGDQIAMLGDLTGKTADHVIDVRNLVVAPGFINMLSWAVDTLIEDGRSKSDIRQGVTLEVVGEGISCCSFPFCDKAFFHTSLHDLVLLQHGGFTRACVDQIDTDRDADG